jgi:hypothetical protein
MIKRYGKYVTTRKPHTCGCGALIPPNTKAYWYKAVAFRDSDVGRNAWEEGYICPKCDNEITFRT